MSTIRENYQVASFVLLTVLGLSSSVHAERPHEDEWKDPVPVATHNPSPAHEGVKMNEQKLASVDTKIIKKAESRGKAGYILGPTIFALSSLPYLILLDGVADGDSHPEPSGYATIIVPIVSAAALTNLIAGPIIFSGGKKVRDQYGVPGDRKWRTAGWTLFILSFLPAATGPIGLQAYLPPLCGLLGGLGLLGLSKDAKVSAQQAKEKVGKMTYAGAPTKTVSLSPSLASLTTKGSTTGFTVGINGTF
jgi:hypothetical protein